MKHLEKDIKKMSNINNASLYLKIDHDDQIFKKGQCLKEKLVFSEGSLKIIILQPKYNLISYHSFIDNSNVILNCLGKKLKNSTEEPNKNIFPTYNNMKRSKSQSFEKEKKLYIKSGSYILKLQ